MPDLPGTDPGAVSSEALGAARELSSSESALAEVLRDLSSRLSAQRAGPVGDRLERELLALISIAGVVGGAARIEEVVDFAADQALQAVGAASLAISRWEAGGRILRVLVNAGELAPGEERRPAAETYPIDDDDVLRDVIEGGRDYRMSVEDPDCHPQERELLLARGKAHSAGVGIRFAGRPWGEIWATRSADQPAFTDDDIRFLHTVTGLIAAAAGRSELFARMAELAYRDPLTGIANRRAVEERLEDAVAEAIAAGGDVALLLCDLDGLKELNDTHGHQAGDEALRRVAAELSEVADGALVARIGGDEFCALLEARSADEARRIGESLLGRLSGGEMPLSASCGVASVGLGSRSAGDLLRAADAAQYTAKRGGRGRVHVADLDADRSWRSMREERRAIRGRTPGPTDVGGLLAGVLHLLDGPLAARPPLDRLEATAMRVGECVEATAVAVSRLVGGGTQISTEFAVDRRTASSSGARFGVVGRSYDTADYPGSVALMTAGGSQLVLADDEDADPGEREVLVDFGMAGVVLAGAPDADGGWLVEVFADGRTAPLAGVEGALRLLVAEAVRQPRAAR